MGAADISFTITPTTGWYEDDGDILGTDGPFCVVIDRFTASVEKILCSAINLTSGVVTVYTSSGFSGRGYDGTSPQAHVPNGSTSGVQTCWSAQEAFEANAAVSYLLGTAGGVQSSGEVLSWEAGAPAWVSPSGVTGISLFGVGAKLTGGTPPAAGSGGFLVQTGSPVVMTNSGGASTYSYPEPFPNGVMSVVTQPIGAFAPSGTQLSVTTWSLTNFSIYWAGAVNTDVQFAYIAWGY
jgi:hypothetical protein